jgi:hypothetical protein
MRRHSAACLALSCAAALAFAACDSADAPPPDTALSCEDLSLRTFRDSAGDDHYRVVSPNGSESFKVGDSLRVLITSGFNDSEAVLELAVFRDGKSTFVPVPGTPRTRIDPRSHCRWNFLIPDSLSAAGKRISAVSDSVKVRVSKYNQGSLVYDYSDAFFRIVP